MGRVLLAVQRDRLFTNQGHPLAEDLIDPGLAMAIDAHDLWAFTAGDTMRANSPINRFSGGFEWLPSEGKAFADRVNLKT